MPTRYFKRSTRITVAAVAFIVLNFVVCTSAPAQSPSILGPCTSNCKPIGGVTTGEVVGVIVGVAAAVAVITVLVIHESHKQRTIKGCVNSGQTAMTVTDEKDKRLYALSGDIAGVKAGERLTLQGKKIKPSDTNPLMWDTKAVTKDFGVCHPDQ
jgi:hypothetical protein